MNLFSLLLITFIKNSKPGEYKVPADPESCRKLLLDNLKFIEERCYKAYGLVAWQNRDDVPGANKADSLFIDVMEHISADNYRVLREYKGKASLRRYLEVVICNKVVDIYRQKEGRSRASEEARKMGAAGVRLYELVNKKGLPIEEAHSVMSREAAFTGGIETLREMADRISSKMTASHSEVSFGTIPSYGQDPECGHACFNPLKGDSGQMAITDEAPGPERAFLEKEKETRMAAVMRELVQSLSTDERLMVRLKYIEGRSVNEISRAIGYTEKAIYKKMDRMLQKCRKMLLKKGIKSEDLL
ncbi:MAG: sigma-70 family RNA polymerase sigma factor [Nitrospirota bacterium]